MEIRRIGIVMASLALALMFVEKTYAAGETTTVCESALNNGLPDSTIITGTTTQVCDRVCVRSTGLGLCTEWKNLFEYKVERLDQDKHFACGSKFTDDWWLEQMFARRGYVVISTQPAKHICGSRCNLYDGTGALCLKEVVHTLYEIKRVGTG